LFGAGEEAQKRMYNTFANGRIYLVTARPRTEAVVEEAVKRMRQLIHQTEFEVPGLNVGLTGEPVLDYDQMLQSKKDATLASVVALLISFLIFTYAYGETRRPLKAVFCLVVGMGYSMGFATLAVGHLNILTITFAPILIGLAIDFGIHFITRYEEEIRNERTEEEALEKAMVFTGQGIVTGGLTTAGAFIAMWLTNFKGIQEMGIICGGGLALSLVPMMTMLPALLVRAGRKGAGHAVGLPAEERARIEGIWLRRPWWVVGGAGALCLLAATQFHKVSFDYNLTHLQSKGLPAVVYDLKLLFATASTFAADDITNLPVLVGKLTAKQDPVSTFVGDHLDLAARSQMASYQCGKQNEDELQAALAKDFNRIIAGPLIFSPDRFRAVSLKPATAQLLRSRPQGEDLMRLNKMLLQDAFPGEVLEHPGQSLLYAAVVADNLKEAAQFERALTNLPAVGSVDGNDRGQPIFELLTKDQSQEMKAARLVKEEVSSLKFAPVDTNEVALHELGMTLYSTTGYLNLAAEEAGKEMPELGAELRSLAESISELRVKMLAEDNPAAPHLLRDYQRALFEDIRQTFESIRNQETGSRLMPQDLPASWRGRFVGRSGKFAVVVFPREDIWQHDVQEKFIHQVRGALGKMGDRLTGMPVQVYEYTTLLKQSYQQAALYSLVAIAFLVYLHFRSVVCVVLSLLPVALGSAWTLGLMGLAGVPFNPANIMTLPLVIGIGVTNGIHILNRVAEEHNANILGKSTGKAVLVSGLTALTGFGSLMLGKHQGLQSLGLVMSAGIAACMIAGLTFLPALISILGEHGWAMTQKKLGDSILALPPSVEEPR
jgi:predicted RND superfamily exporter protein